MEYWKAIIIAATPAFLYYLGLFIMIHQEAVRLGLKGLPKEEIPPLGEALKESWFFLVPFAVMLILLVGLHYSAATSAIAAILAIVIFSNLTKRTRMGPKKWLDALGGITQGLPQVGTSIVVAGVLDGSFQLTGVGLVLAQKLVELAGGSTVILTLLVAIALFILGLGLSVVACYLLAVVLLVPAMIMMGVHPLAAHFFVIWMAQAALITPPVCQPAFFAAGIAGAPLMAAGWQACRLGIVVYLVPIFWVFDPALLLVGSWDHIMLAIISTIVGIVYLSCGISGLMLTKSPWWERILVIVGGVCLLVPVIFVKLIGLALVAIPTIRQASLYLVEKRMARTAKITQSSV
jgi:TRAP transporter 4TM/12TM fusion protein